MGKVECLEIFELFKIIQSRNSIMGKINISDTANYLFWDGIQFIDKSDAFPKATDLHSPWFIYWRPQRWESLLFVEGVIRFYHIIYY